MIPNIRHEQIGQGSGDGFLGGGEAPRNRRQEDPSLAAWSGSGGMPRISSGAGELALTVTPDKGVSTAGGKLRERRGRWGASPIADRRFPGPEAEFGD